MTASRMIAARDTVWQRLRVGYAVNRNNNPHVLGVMASPPTVTLTSTQPSGMTKAYPYNTAGAFYYTGGDSVDFASACYRFPVATIQFQGAGGNVGSGRNAAAWRVRCIVDAVAPVFRFLGSNPVRFIVADANGQNGRYVDTTGTTLTQGGNNNWIQLDFTSIGGRDRRMFIIEGEYAQGFAGCYVGPTESVEPAPTGLRITVLGDSITVATGATRANDGFATVFADAFGVPDLRQSGMASQGYLNLGSGSTYALLDRLPYDAIDSDLFAVAMGTNDVAQNQTSLAAKVPATILYLRQNFPSRPVIVLGCPANSSGPSAGSITCDNTIINGALGMNDPLVIAIPNSNASPNSMLFGTGKVGSTNNSGNSDIYVSSDGTHPPTAGHKYCGLWYADRVMSAIDNL